VAGLLWEYTPGQTPFITEIYAVPVKGDEDNLGPVHSLPHWLLAILTRPATHYGTLLKQVEAINNWGVMGEVLQFQQLKHYTSDLCLRIAHLEAELRGVMQAQSTYKRRLELAHLKRPVANLHVLSTVEP
jgi:hypothetical protein